MLRPTTGLDFPGAPDPSRQQQPVGFDLTCASVSAFAMQGSLDLSNENRSLPDLRELAWEGEEPLLLRPGGYLVNYNEVIDVPLDCAGIVLPRSSLLRCGAALHTALWEPGYKGRGYGLLTVHHQIALHRDARIAQFILMPLEQAAAVGYTGAYQGENL